MKYMKEETCAVLLVVLFCLLLLPQGLIATELDMSLGDIKLEFNQHNPIIVSVRDAKDTSFSTSFSTDVYDKKTSLSSEGSINFTEGILATDSTLKALFEDGNFQSTISEDGSDSTVSIKGKNGITSVRIEYSSGEETDDKQVDVGVVTKKAEKGILKVNHQEDNISVSTAEELRRSLKISMSDARDLVDEYGKARISDTLDGLNDYSRNGSANNNVAGGAGMISGGGAVDINRLGSSSYFHVMVDGVKVAGRLMDPAIQVKIIHPNGERELKGFTPTVTVTKITEDGSKEEVVLIANLPFDEGRGYYYLNFHDIEWLVDYDKLPAGLYKVYVDIGRNKRVTLGAQITDDGKLMPAR